jgi:hypothetical protein
MPTIAELATELGLDASTFKPEAVAKWNTYFTDADAQYKTAKELKDASEHNLRQVTQEQNAINEYIEQYGASETATAALRANNAAMEAQLKALKEQGIAVTVPDPIAPTNPTKPANVFDENKFRGQVSNVLSQSINLNNRYQTLYGKPLPDDIDALADQASKAGKQLFQYAAEKYDFAGEEKRKSDATKKAEIDAAVAAGVKKYQDEHPNVAGNPFMNGGGDSRNPQILRRGHDSKDLKEYANLTPREKIARSISNSRELLAANQQ